MVTQQHGTFEEQLAAWRQHIDDRLADHDRQFTNVPEQIANAITLLGLTLGQQLVNIQNKLEVEIEQNQRDHGEMKQWLERLDRREAERTVEENRRKLLAEGRAAERTRWFKLGKAIPGLLNNAVKAAAVIVMLVAAAALIAGDLVNIFGL